MRLAAALGIALASLAVGAYAHQEGRVVIRDSGGGLNIDADGDGWMTRAEAGAAADQIFGQMDANNDGRLDAEDRQEIFELRLGGEEADVLEGENGARRVRVIRRGGEHDAEVEREIELALREAERDVLEARREAREAEREAQEALRDARREAQEAREHRREIIIVQGGGEWAPAAPVAPAPPTPPVAAIAPLPPHPPMFMMLIANSEEADLNNDGALSREEFRAQHLRFFDASDANQDGRVRVGPMATSAVAPAAPATPAAPRPPARR